MHDQIAVPPPEQCINKMDKIDEMKVKEEREQDKYLLK